MGNSITQDLATPKPGQLAVIRGRPGVVRDVNTVSGPGEASSLLFVDYIDGEAFPSGEWIAWEREPHTRLISQLALPQISSAQNLPESPSLFSSFLNSYRWSSLNRLAPSREEENSLQALVSPWHNAIQIEDYQLYPVYKALQMPRVSLLLADDVGLGKTIEAGLILSELILRRRVQRVLVLCPASLQLQWRDELEEKFHLDFVIVDREQRNRARREFGSDANPWQIYPRAITSMDYLRQPDVLEAFRATATTLHQGPRLPFQLLIVDEAHNLAPSVFNDDSDRCRMLRGITRYFEHRLFLSATPHNGYTATFSGLLSILDPVRMQQTSQLEEEDRKQVELLMVRRLKSELKLIDGKRRFVDRTVESLPLSLKDHPQDKSLYDLVREYRNAIRTRGQSLSRRERRIYDFVIMLLAKRLLSSSYAFARTWWRHVEGSTLDAPNLPEVEHALNKAEAELADDSVKAQREEDAARQTGSWFTQADPKIVAAMQRIGDALNAMGWSSECVNDDVPAADAGFRDAKTQRLLDLIEKILLRSKQFVPEERLIIFTEYKDTLDYVTNVLEKVGYVYPVVDCLYGGMDTAKREEIKGAFNDPTSPIRILVATDTAAEGLNLQTSCRYIVHYEIPWNPMRLEQRNGRVDRHGQSRDVTIYHFTADDDADHRLLSHVIQKVNQAREDLGSLGQVIDQSVIEHFTRGELGESDLDQRLNLAGESQQDTEDTELRDRGSEREYELAVERLRMTERSMGLTPESLASLLTHAVEMEGGRVHEEAAGVYRLHAIPPSWKSLVQRSLALRKGEAQSALPKLVFDPSHFEEVTDQTIVFRTKRDTALIRLGHPVMRRALGVLQRKLWESQDGGGAGQGSISRWTVTQSESGTHGRVLIVVNCLLEVTNQLRESMHTEFIEVPLVVTGGSLSDVPMNEWETLRANSRREIPLALIGEVMARVRRDWADVEDRLESILLNRKNSYQVEFTKSLSLRQKEELRLTRQDYNARIKDMERRDEKWLVRQKREFERQMARLSQRELFNQDEVGKELRMKELEWETYRRENKQLLDLLTQERDRQLGAMIPLRYSLGNLEFWPIGIEIVVPTLD